MSDKTIIHIIDDDAAIRDSLTFLLDVNGYAAKAWETADDFLKDAAARTSSCIISDISLARCLGSIDWNCSLNSAPALGLS